MELSIPEHIASSFAVPTILALVAAVGVLFRAVQECYRNKADMLLEQLRREQGLRAAIGKPDAEG